MSIFDQYNSLPGDKNARKIRSDFEEYKFDHQKSTEIGNKLSRPIWLFYLISLLVFAALIAQLLKLQVSQGNFNRLLAKSNSLRARQTQAPRGVIYDSKGKPFLLNDASYRLEIFPQDLPKNNTDRDQIYESLSQIAQIPAAQIKDEVNAGSSAKKADPVILKENIDRDTALLLEVKTANLAGVTIDVSPVRNYLGTLGMSPILGYVGKVTDQELKNDNELRRNDVVGKDGLEKTYETYLRGKDGVEEIEVDSRGREQRQISTIPPVPGDSLALTVSLDLENIMAQTLQSEIQAAGATAGSVVAINPQTGAVLGMASIPTYDNNLFSRGISTDDYSKLINDPAKPLFNRAIAGTYPSGSTIKPFMASAGLQEGTITPNTTISDTGEIDVNNYQYRDWKAHGLVNVTKAIAESCDVFFYSLGGGWDKIKGLGVAKIDEYLTKFGFGKALGVDIPGEVNGLVPSPDWKEKIKKESWYLGDTYHLSIGQGDFLVTPLQLADATAAIANGGKVYQPYLVSSIKDSQGKIVQQKSPIIISQGFVSSDNIDIVRQGMREAVTGGTARQFSDLPVAVAAKTGTAQFGDADKTHAWMTAFAPFNDPQIAIAVIIEGGGEGYAAAGPVVKNILNYYFTNPQ